MSEYPEHEKLQAISDESQTIGAFLDTCGYVLCESRDAGDNGEPRYLWVDEPTATRGREKKERGVEPDLYDYSNGDAIHNPEFAEWPAGYYPLHRSINQVLAEYFDIDLEAIDREKTAMLEALRRG